MKLPRLIALVSMLSTLVLCVAACASGDLGPNKASQSESDAHEADVDDDAWTGAGDAATDGAGDTAGAPDANSDDAGSDASPSDSGPGADIGSDVDDGGTTGPCENVDCADGVCDPSTGACVGCLADTDCGPDLVCDTGTSTCVECLVDGDCVNGGRCHDREPVCVPDCCDNVTQQDSFTSVSYSHNRFDIGVTSAGDPSIAFVDGNTDTIKFAQSVGGQWLSQDIGSVSDSLSTNIRMAYAPNDTPHVIVGRYEMLKHFWRDQSGWQSHDLLATPGSVGYVDIAADDHGNIHMVALLDYGDQVLYAHQSAAGQRTEEYLTLPAQNDPVWVNVATTSDARPFVSFQIGLDKTVVIAEQTVGGNWQYETIGQDVSQLHGLAVGPSDEPTVAYRKATNDGLRLLRRQGQTWQDVHVVADADHGYSPDIAIDSLGDPHIVYMAQGAGQYENPLYYARWNGAAWEHHEITGVDRAFYPRVALDQARTPHVVVYDPSRDAISYLQIR